MICRLFIALGLCLSIQSAHANTKLHHGSQHHTSPASLHSVKKTGSVDVGKTPLRQSGVASFYGPGLWGRPTSSGAILHSDSMTAAHLHYPLGTKLLVINRDNGKSVKVTVNDRGPYVGHRIIDLAEKPAKILDMKKAGTANVSIVALHVPDHNVMEVASYEPRRPHIYHAPSVRRHVGGLHVRRHRA